MKVEVIRAYAVYRRGCILDMPEGQARVLIARGLLKPVETATVENTEERATLPNRPIVHRRQKQ